MLQRVFSRRILSMFLENNITDFIRDCHVFGHPTWKVSYCWPYRTRLEVIVLLMKSFGIATWPWILALCRYRRTVFVHTVSVKCVFISAVITEAVAFSFRAIIRAMSWHPYKRTSILPSSTFLFICKRHLGYCSLSLSFEVFVTDALAGHVPTIWSLLKSEMS